MGKNKQALANKKSDAEQRWRESFITMSRYLSMHRPCVEEELTLEDGSILEDIRKRGKLARHQVLAWRRWHSTVQSILGHTNDMHVSYEEKVDVSADARDAEQIFESEEYATGNAQALAKKYGPRTSLTPEGAEYLELWDFLRHEERGLVEYLTRDYHRVSGMMEIHAGTLAALGTILSGYNDNRQAIAAGVSGIQRVLNSMAQFYGLSRAVN